jgi:DNA-binding FadR family transcriptional regulator
VTDYPTAASTNSAAAAFVALAREHGLDPAVLALAWVLAQDGVVSAVVGPESVAELTAQIEKLEGLVAMPSAYVHEDLKFHDIIMRMSGDRLSKAIIDGIQSEALRTHGYSGKLSVEHVRLTQDAHRKVYEAIAAGDAHGASTAMRAHIAGSWDKRRAQPRG